MGRQVTAARFSVTRSFNQTEFIAETELLAIDASISQDGDFAVFTVAFADIAPIKFVVPIEDIARIQHPVHTAASLMMHRQRLKHDRGRAKLRDLTAAALRPIGIEVDIDQLTGDRFFTHQFANHSPLCLRMTEDSVDESLLRLTDAIRRTRN